MTTGNRRMRIAAVTICVDYSDFLAHALPLNRAMFDDYVVVTSPADAATQRLCAHHHVRCIPTDVFYCDGAKFNKGAGINVGLAALVSGTALAAGPTWLCHLDADIVLPPRTRDFLERAELDPECIYGIDRLMVPDFLAWMRYVASPTPRFADEVFISLDPFPIGTRIGRREAGGYVPIGFFQLWNAASPHGRDYPCHHTTAARSDMLFSLRWPRRERHLLPEIVALHLDSGSEPMGANWEGRRTPHFGPKD